MPCSMTLGSAAPVLQMVSLASVKAESSAMIGHDWTCFGGGGMDVEGCWSTEAKPFLLRARGPLAAPIILARGLPLIGP